MRKLALLAAFTVVAVLTLAVNSAHATFQEVIIWDPNGNFGTFTDPTPNFATILAQLSAASTIPVAGGGAALTTAVTGAPSGSVIEITDSATYDGAFSSRTRRISSSERQLARSQAGTKTGAHRC